MTNAEQNILEGQMCLLEVLLHNFISETLYPILIVEIT